jgi:hypothetical protein
MMYDVRIENQARGTVRLCSFEDVSEAEDFAIRQALGGYTRTVMIYAGPTVIARYMRQDGQLHKVTASGTSVVDTRRWIEERDAAIRRRWQHA